eukprot:896323-Pyramimonas_sp.AAC.1
MGDFNARVGSSVAVPNGFDPVGPCGPGQVNEAGQRLVEFCTDHSLIVADTFFHAAGRGTWFHAPSRRWCSIDHILTRARDRRSVTSVIPLIAAECDTDHRLVPARIRLPPKRRFLFHSGLSRWTRPRKLDVKKAQGGG